MKVSELKKIIHEEFEKVMKELSEPVGMPLNVAKKRGQDIHGRQYNDLTTLGGKIVTKQDKAVSNFEKNIAPLVARALRGAYANLNYIPKNTADYRKVEDMIKRSEETNTVLTAKEEAAISYLAGKHGLKETGKEVSEIGIQGGLSAEDVKMWGERAKKMSKDGLLYSIKDCQDAIKANMNPDKYYDQLSIFRSELNRRKGIK